MNKNLLIAAGVFAVLLAAVVATQSRDVKVGVHELTLPHVERDAISRVDVVIPGKPAPGSDAKADAGPADAGAATPAHKLTLERSGAGFVVYDTDHADKKFPVDESQVKGLLDAVVELQAGDVIANKKDKHAELEIDDDKGTLVTIHAGSTTTTLVFGRAAKGGGSTVRLQNADEVFVGKGRLGSLVKKELNGWRKRVLVEGKPDDFTRVAVKQADGTSLVVQADTPPPPPPPAPEPDGGTPPPPPPPATTTWKLVEPATLPAGFRLDEASLSRLASSLSTLRASDFADGIADDAAGLAGAHVVVEATKRDGSKLVVHLGKEDDQKRTYAKLEGDPQVYLLASYAAKQLGRTLDDLRDLTLAPGSVDDVEQATFVAGKTKVVVKRDGAEWKRIEPKTAPEGFDDAQIGNAVAAVTRLRGARYLGAADSVKDAATSTSETYVELSGKGGKKASVRFGASIPPADASAKPTENYVSGSDGALYAINAFQKQRYEKPFELFKKPPPPPQGMGGGMNGFENLPPDVRKKLEAAMKNGQFGQ